VVILPVTGLQFEEIVEDMLSWGSPGNQISGFSFVYDPDMPPGSRVKLDDIISRQTGNSIIADSTYYLAVSDYMYNVNSLLWEIPRIDTQYLIRELMITYIEANSPFFYEVEARMAESTFVKENKPLHLDVFRLEQNYPNPFNTCTTIPYSPDKKCRLNLKIYTINGHLITTLLNSVVEGGEHFITWDGLDSHGLPVASGIYLFAMETATKTKIRKMTLGIHSINDG